MRVGPLCSRNTSICPLRCVGCQTIARGGGILHLLHRKWGCKLFDTNFRSSPCLHVLRIPAMVPLTLPFENLTNIKLFLFHNDVGGAGDIDPLVHIDVGRDNGLTLNEPDWDAHFEEPLTDFRIRCEGPHPPVESQMKVARREGDWHVQIVEHAEYVKTETLEQCENQDSIVKCEC